MTSTARTSNKKNAFGKCVSTKAKAKTKTESSSGYPSDERRRFR